MLSNPSEMYPSGRDRDWTRVSGKLTSALAVPHKRIWMLAATNLLWLQKRLRIRMGMRKFKLKRPKKWAAPQCEEGKLLRSATFPQAWLPVQGHRESCTTFPGLCLRYIVLSRETGGDGIRLWKRKDSREQGNTALINEVLARWSFQ